MVLFAALIHIRATSLVYKQGYKDRYKDRDYPLCLSPDGMEQYLKGWRMADIEILEIT